MNKIQTDFISIYMTKDQYKKIETQAKKDNMHFNGVLKTVLSIGINKFDKCDSYNTPRGQTINHVTCLPKSMDHKVCKITTLSPNINYKSRFVNSNVKE